MSYNRELDVFIHGENVNLCIPTRDFAENSHWYSWMNDPQLTRYLGAGAFPNTPQQQVRFYEEQHEQRLLLIVEHRGKYVGVISLSQIDFLAGNVGSMAMVISNKEAGRMTPWVSLESIARITEHAMENMGINRINSGQHIDLVKWQNRKEVLGYRLEGIFEDGFTKGHERRPLLRSSLVRRDYLSIKEHREGNYWDGLEIMKGRIRALPENTAYKKLVDYYSEMDEYYKKIFQI